MTGREASIQDKLMQKGFEHIICQDGIENEGNDDNNSDRAREYAMSIPIIFQLSS